MSDFIISQIWDECDDKVGTNEEIFSTAGYIDEVANDSNGDGYLDRVERDRDFDGVPDYIVTDSNGDGKIDRVERDRDFDAQIYTDRSYWGR